MLCSEFLIESISGLLIALMKCVNHVDLYKGVKQNDFNRIKTHQRLQWRIGGNVK